MHRLARTITQLRRAAVEESLLLRVDAGYRPRHGWRRRQPCTGLPIDWWFENAELGADLCRTCPVRLDCLVEVCAAERDVPLDHILGFQAVSHRARHDWQQQKRGLNRPLESLHPLVALIIKIEDEEAAQARGCRQVAS